MPSHAPKNLGKEAKKLWKGVTETFDLSATELRILEDACREVDLIEKLEEALWDPANPQPLTVRGSQGQPVANPLIQEIRQHRQVVKTLLGALKLPEEPAADQSGSGNRSTSAREAAMARWRKGA